MPNTETDQLQMVETTTVQGGNWLFRKRVNVDTGFSLQVFRASGEYLGSVDNPRERINVRDGDTVLRVNTGGQTLDFTGKLHTLDGHARDYEASIIIQVSDPAQFAICYRQKSDPVGRAHKAIDAYLVNWAAGMNHDDISEAMLRYRAERALVVRGREIGVEVVSAEKIIAHRSPTKQEAVDLIHKDDVRVIQHGIDVQVNTENREEHAKDRAAERQQAAFDTDAALAADTRKRVIGTVVSAYQRQLNELFDQGFTLDEINRDHPDIMKTLSTLAGASADEKKLLTGGEQNAASALYDADATIYAGSRPANQGEWRVDPIGAFVTPVPLTPDQQRLVEDQHIDIEQVFQIIRMDQGGPAALANLLAGDILLQANGQPHTDIAALRMLLTPGSPIAQIRPKAQIHFLRGTNLYAVSVEVAG